MFFTQFMHVLLTATHMSHCISCISERRFFPDFVNIFYSLRLRVAHLYEFIVSINIQSDSLQFHFFKNTWSFYFISIVIHVCSIFSRVKDKDIAGFTCSAISGNDFPAFIIKILSCFLT